jgi:ubiquitin-conjugating enzyme E2 variant
LGAKAASSAKPKSVSLVDQVDPRGFAILAQWKEEYSIETILVGLRNEMTSSQNRKLSQPPEGTNF